MITRNKISAKAGIHFFDIILDSRLRGNDTFIFIVRACLPAPVPTEGGAGRCGQLAMTNLFGI